MDYTQYYAILRDLENRLAIFPELKIRVAKEFLTLVGLGILLSITIFFLLDKNPLILGLSIIPIIYCGYILAYALRSRYDIEYFNNINDPEFTRHRLTDETFRKMIKDLDNLEYLYLLLEKIIEITYIIYIGGLLLSVIYFIKFRIM